MLVPLLVALALAFGVAGYAAGQSGSVTVRHDSIFCHHGVGLLMQQVTPDSIVARLTPAAFDSGSGGFAERGLLLLPGR